VDLLAPYWIYVGNRLSDLPFTVWAVLMADYIGYGSYVPRKFSHEMSLKMAERAEEMGVQIEYRQRVEKILVKDGKAYGVRTAHGEEIHSDYVICSAYPNKVYSSMIEPADAVPAGAIKMVNGRRLSLTAFSVVMILDKSAEELGIKDYSVFIMTDPDPRKQFEHKDGVRTFVVNCLNKVLPESSPEGTCTLFFTIMYMPGEMDETLRAQDYKKYKNEIAEEYIRRYEETIGVSVRDHIEEIVVATPVTFARYLGTPDGAIYGYANEAWDNVVTRTVTKDMDFKVPNLYFCGGHYIRGDGYPSAYITGAMTARDVIKDLKEGK
jgi:prolycopene isomerase